MVSNISNINDFLTDQFDLEMGILTCPTTFGQSGPGSNGNENGTTHFLISRTEASLSDTVYCHTPDTIWFIDGILIDTTTFGQSGPGSNGNKRVTQHFIRWSLESFPRHSKEKARNVD